MYELRHLINLLLRIETALIIFLSLLIPHHVILLLCRWDHDKLVCQQLLSLWT